MHVCVCVWVCVSAWVLPAKRQGTRVETVKGLKLRRTNRSEGKQRRQYGGARGDQKAVIRMKVEWQKVHWSPRGETNSVHGHTSNWFAHRFLKCPSPSCPLLLPALCGMGA